MARGQFRLFPGVRNAEKLDDRGLSCVTALARFHRECPGIAHRLGQRRIAGWWRVLHRLLGLRPGEDSGLLGVCRLRHPCPLGSGRRHSLAHDLDPRRHRGKQLPGRYSIGSSDYGQAKIQGFSAFADYDILVHWGVEGDIHSLTIWTPDDIAENSYLAGTP